MTKNICYSLIIYLVVSIVILLTVNPLYAQNINSSETKVSSEIFNESNSQDENMTNFVFNPSNFEPKNISLVTPQPSNFEQNISLGYLKVLTQVENKCSDVPFGHCFNFEEYNRFHIVNALQWDNTIKEIVGPNEGRSVGWMYPLYIYDSQNGLQYNVRPAENPDRDLNITLSSDCEGILMNGENKTCTIKYGSSSISP